MEIGDLNLGPHVVQQALMPTGPSALSQPFSFKLFILISTQRIRLHSDILNKMCVCSSSHLFPISHQTCTYPPSLVASCLPLLHSCPFYFLPSTLLLNLYDLVHALSPLLYPLVTYTETLEVRIYTRKRTLDSCLFCVWVMSLNRVLSRFIHFPENVTFLYFSPRILSLCSGSHG